MLCGGELRDPREMVSASASGGNSCSHLLSAQQAEGSVMTAAEFVKTYERRVAELGWPLGDDRVFFWQKGQALGTPLNWILRVLE